MLKNKKGFTLIELLIVVAIIAILAAIAIPQFAQYRIKGYNSSSLTDLRNGRTTQEALFADYQRYGRTEAAALPGTGVGAGVILMGPGLAATPNILTLTDSQAGLRGIQTPTGTGVNLLVKHDVPNESSFTGASKHLQGNVTYGVDSDSTATYRLIISSTVGVNLVDGDSIAPGAGTDEYAAAAALWQTL
jgi:prepilin-type N-terminal cleavage/methylation domain-containing protein